MQLRKQQAEAVEKIVQWYNDPKAPLQFYLGGYAGSGKTFIARHVIGLLLGEKASSAIYAAATGKAAAQMRKSGCEGALTAHKVIYTAGASSAARMIRLQVEYADIVQQCVDGGMTQEEAEALPIPVELARQIAEEEARAKSPKFERNPESDLRYCPLACLDECSMIGRRLGEDWMSFKVKTLVLGDPAQLPPVGSEGFFTKGGPDYMLTEVHRQAEGSPVLELATMCRNMKVPPEGRYGESRVVKRSDLTPDDMRSLVSWADQVLVGKNATRHAYNSRIRALRGIKDPFPMEGEQVVCLRNNHDAGLLNGEIYTVTRAAQWVKAEEGDFLEMDIVGQGSDIEQTVLCWPQHFRGQEKSLPVHFGQKLAAEEFDFSAALTVHKFQGSQAPNVLVIDESFIAGADRYKWLYTAVTRAQQRVTVIV